MQIDNRPLISYYNNRISTDTFFEQVDKVANALNSLGLKCGDNIALCLPNIPNAIIIFYAANKLGIAVNLIHPLVPSKALGEIIKTHNSKVAFVFDLFFNKHKDVLAGMDIFCVLCRASDYLKNVYKFGYNVYMSKKKTKLTCEKAMFFSEFLKKQDKIACEREHYEGIGEEIAAFIHSGGTTGVPKTAMIPNRAINECSYSIRTLINSQALCCRPTNKFLPFAKKAICFFYYPQCKLLYLPKVFHNARAKDKTNYYNKFNEIFFAKIDRVCG